MNTVSVVCPACLSRFHLQPDVIGKRMRCPSCKEPFEARAETVEPKPSVPPAPSDSRPGRAASGDRPLPPKANYVSGDVRDLLQVATAENPAPPAPAPQELDWRSAPPPPVRTNGTPPSVTPPTPPPSKAKPRPEPVASVPPPADPPVESHPVEAEDESLVSELPPQRGSLNKFLFGVGLAFLGCVLVGGAVGIVYFLTQTESRMRLVAEQLYAEGRYGDAAQKFQQLGDSFSASPERPRYGFFQRLSELRRDASSPARDPGEVLIELQEWSGGPPREQLEYFENYQIDLAETYIRVAEALTAGLEEQLQEAAVNEVRRDPSAVRDVIAQLRDRLVSIDTIRERLRGLKGQLPASVDDKVQALRLLADVETRRADLMEQVVATLGDPLDYPKLEQAEAAVRDARLRDDAAFNAILRQAREELTKLVRYIAEESPVLPGSVPPPAPPGVLFAPEVVRPLQAGEPGHGIVFAAANGVLYGLDEADGSVRWACRVGVDADQLPLRVPADEIDPEFIIVTSADGTALTARDLHTGAVRWHQPLEFGSVIGTPVLIDRRLYVPLRAAPGASDRGVVVELEVKGGARLGRIEVGQPLAAGAARQPGTYRLVVAADRDSVYVLNVDPVDKTARTKPLVAALPTGHAAGSLRGEPLVVGDEPAPPGSAFVAEAGQTFLILAQSDGLWAMQLKAFPLLQPPLPGAPSLGAEPARELRLDGWTWSTPHSDGEKLALVTDAGRFALLGINQTGNFDAPLFSLPPRPPTTLNNGTRSRGQVVYATENAFWAVVGGRLSLYRLGLDLKDGMKLAEVWGTPVGTPLHAGQLTTDRSALVVATRSALSPACLATAVDLDEGRVRWQRKLGLNCLRDPVLVDGKVVALDLSGGLLIDDPAKRPPSNTEWRIGGEQIVLPPRGLADDPLLLAEPDGSAVWRVAFTREKGIWHVIANRFPPPGPGQSDRDAVLPAAPAGPPVLVGRSLVLPLVNGFLRRLDLVPGRDGLERGGVTWRAARLGPEVPAWVAAIGANDVVSFDGYRTLTRWRLQADVGLARASEVLLGERLAGPLVTVPTDVEGQSFLAGLDSTGQLLLLDDKLKVARTWKMPGTPTAGPLVRRLGEGPYRIGLVIDRTKFLWLDPVRAEPLWVYDTRGQGIAGLPHLDASGRLLVADAGGMIVTLDPSTGEPTGPSWKLTEELVPDATPVPYGPGRLFAPLTDGTVLLLPEP